MDWPADNRQHLPVISSYSEEALGPMMLSSNFTSAMASVAYIAANLATFVPMTIWAPFLVRKVWWANGAAVAGNVDVGVYTLDGTLLLSAGATAQATTSAVQSVSLGTAVLLEPGSYYLALSTSSATSAFLSCHPAAMTAIRQQLYGCAEMASAEPLPATATLAACSHTSLPPFFGITNRTLI